MQVIDEQLAVFHMHHGPLSAGAKVEFAFRLAAVKCFVSPGEVLDQPVDVVLMEAYGVFLSVSIGNVIEINQLVLLTIFFVFPWLLFATVCD